MASSFHKFLISSLLAVAVAVFCCTGSGEAGLARDLLATAAPAPPPQHGGAAPDEYLSGQNQARTQVGVAPLRWNLTLVAVARRIVEAQRAAKCQFADLSSSRYGANQAWASYPVTAVEAVRSWVAEGKYYDYGNNSCTSGHQCGTYTQVVWKNSAEVGCAQANCTAAKGGEATTSSLTLCLYYPPGNIQGQKPY